MSLRADLVLEMLRQEAPVHVIAAKYGVSRTTAYKWFNEFQAEGRSGMADRSRRPKHSPNKTSDEVEDAICAVRDEHPTWGCEKIHHVLSQQDLPGLPVVRTVGRILKRRGYTERKPPAQTEFTRFQWEAPNELWQIDFKKTVYLSSNPRTKASPMTIEDDHSRFNLALRANPNRQVPTIWPVLWEVFGEYGLPAVILTDNDTVFRGHRGGITAWTARLLRLGVRHISGRAYHPQTQGKVERLHGTIQTDVLDQGVYHTYEELQAAFDEFRDVYNHQRPHAALDMDVPSSHYRPSTRKRPKQIPPVEYPEGSDLRKVMRNGAISVRNCRIHIGEGIAGEHVRLHDQGEMLAIEYAGHIIRHVRYDELRKDRWV